MIVKEWLMNGFFKHLSMGGGTIGCLSRSLHAVSIVLAQWDQKKEVEALQKWLETKLAADSSLFGRQCSSVSNVWSHFSWWGCLHTQQNCLCKLKVDDITWQTTFTRVKYGTIPWCNPILCLEVLWGMEILWFRPIRRHQYSLHTYIHRIQYEWFSKTASEGKNFHNSKTLLCP